MASCDTTCVLFKVNPFAVNFSSGYVILSLIPHLVRYGGSTPCSGTRRSFLGATAVAFSSTVSTVQRPGNPTAPGSAMTMFTWEVVFASIAKAPLGFSASNFLPIVGLLQGFS